MKSLFFTYLLLSGLIAYSQNVGIGTETPAGKLHIKGNEVLSQLVIDASPTQGSIPLVRLRNALGQDILHIYARGSSNIFIGNEAGKENNSGTGNTAIGSLALKNNADGNDNVALGIAAMLNNTSGGRNSAVGYASLSSNILGVENTAVGAEALRNNDANNNTGVGFKALRNNLSGDYNTSIGNWALEANYSGDHNTAVGNWALQPNHNGGYNTAVGSGALAGNIAAVRNTAVGANALRNSNSNYNTAVGSYSLYNTTIGAGNTALGEVAMLGNTTGTGNTAVGNEALYYNSTGNFNIAIGYDAGTNNLNQYNNTISIGNHNFKNGWHNQVFLGNTDITWNGGNVPWLTFSDARIKTNINSDVKGLDFILRLRPVTYYRSTKAALDVTGNSDKTIVFAEKNEIEKIKFSGFLAQEVLTAAKESGYDFSGVQLPKNTSQLYSLSYETFVVPLVKAVQEQQTIIEEQNKKIDVLMNELKIIKAKIKD